MTITLVIVDLQCQYYTCMHNLLVNMFIGSIAYTIIIKLNCWLFAMGSKLKLNLKQFCNRKFERKETSDSRYHWTKFCAMESTQSYCFHSRLCKVFWYNHTILWPKYTGRLNEILSFLFWFVNIPVCVPYFGYEI